MKLKQSRRAEQQDRRSLGPNMSVSSLVSPRLRVFCLFFFLWKPLLFWPLLWLQNLCANRYKRGWPQQKGTCVTIWYLSFDSFSFAYQYVHECSSIYIYVNLLWVWIYQATNTVMQEMQLYFSATEHNLCLKLFPAGGNLNWSMGNLVHFRLISANQDLFVLSKSGWVPLT